MKKLILAAALALSLFSCTKNNEPQPKKAQITTYKVDCVYCLVYIEDAVWNRTNEQERSKNQHFNVNGHWKYSFPSDSLSQATLRVVVSVFGGNQQVKASITTNDGLKSLLDREMGVESIQDTTIKLDLHDSIH